jgi:hypothetical protein
MGQEDSIHDQAIEHLAVDDLAAKFDQVSILLDDLNIADLWDEATETERRKLLDELLAGVTVHPDRLQVEIHGAPPVNVAFGEVGLRDSGLSGVGGALDPLRTRIELR